jgi:hypothetical protein
MKKILLSLAAIPLATFALEASAQSSYNGYGNVNANAGVGVQNRIVQLETRLNAGVQAGSIDRNEARTLRQQIRQLRQMEMQYSANGLTQQERSTLQQRIRSVRDQLRTAYGRGYAYDDSGWDNYGNAYGTNTVRTDQYGRPLGNNSVTYDQYGRAVANNGVAYDQYGRPVGNSSVTYDQYGRPIQNGYYGQGGPYEPVPQNNGAGGVLGSVLGSVVGGGSGVGGILGTILGNGGLRSGDVITNTIGSVLSRGTTYGSQYQDNSNVYYRSDGQRVYEIDARTNRVIRVYNR